MVYLKNKHYNNLLSRTNHNINNNSKNRCPICNHQLFKITDDGLLEIKCKKCKTIHKYNVFDLLSYENTQ